MLPSSPVFLPSFFRGRFTLLKQLQLKLNSDFNLTWEKKSPRKLGVWNSKLTTREARGYYSIHSPLLKNNGRLKLLGSFAITRISIPAVGTQIDLPYLQ